MEFCSLGWSVAVALRSTGLPRGLEMLVEMIIFVKLDLCTGKGGDEVSIVVSGGVFGAIARM